MVQRSCVLCYFAVGDHSNRRFLPFWTIPVARRWRQLRDLFVQDSRVRNYTVAVVQRRLARRILAVFRRDRFSPYFRGLAVCADDCLASSNKAMIGGRFVEN